MSDAEIDSANGGRASRVLRKLLKERRGQPRPLHNDDTAHRRPEPSLPDLGGWLDRPIPSIDEE